MTNSECLGSITSLSFRYFPILYSPDSVDPTLPLEDGCHCGSALVSMVLLAVLPIMPLFIAVPTYQFVSWFSSSNIECLWMLPLIPIHSQSHFFISQNIH